MTRHNVNTWENITLIWQGNVENTYRRHYERKEKGVITPSDAVIHPLAMVVTSVDTVVALLQV